MLLLVLTFSYTHIIYFGIPFFISLSFLNHLIFIGDHIVSLLWTSHFKPLVLFIYCIIHSFVKTDCASFSRFPIQISSCGLCMCLFLPVLIQWRKAVSPRMVMVVERVVGSTVLIQNRGGELAYMLGKNQSTQDPHFSSGDLSRLPVNGMISFSLHTATFYPCSSIYRDPMSVSWQLRFLHAWPCLYLHRSL